MKLQDSSHAAAADGLRVLCIFMIGWYHIWQQSWLYPALNIGALQLDFMPCVRTGYMYVDIMLALSGFLLYLPYANDKARPVKEFYIRRALRILPGYCFCLLVMLIFAVTAPGFTDVGRLIKDLLAHLGFIHNLWRFSYHGTLFNGALWTLAVEVQFYLILPVLAPVFKRHPLLTYLAMTGVGLSFICLWTLPMQDTTLFVNRLPNMLVVYANGMLAAHLYAAVQRVNTHRGWIAAAGTLLCIASLWGIGWVQRQQMWASDFDMIRAGQLRWRWLFSLCGSGFLLGGSVAFRAVRVVLSNPLIRFLSGVSYHFYLWHQWLAVRLKEWRIPPYAAPENPNFEGEMPWQLDYTLICFGAALALAIALTYLVEKPCARLGRKWLEVR